MSAAELVYFEGAHFAHVAAWEERQRLARIRRRAEALLQRERRSRPR